MNSLARTIRRAVLTRFNAIFFGVVAAYGLSVWGLTRLYNMPTFFSSAYYSFPMQVSMVVFAIMFVLWRILYVMLVIRPRRRLTLEILRDLRGWFTAERIFTGLPMMIILPLFFSFFTTAKNLIPIIRPFSWDPAIVTLEQTLHFGRLPWEWLQPFIGFPFITMGISFFYKLWFIIKFLVMYWQGFSLRRTELREQFFIALAIIWIMNGTILATLFSSVGPCFFGLAYPDLADPYAAQMVYLHGVQDVAFNFELWSQNYLWQAYTGHTPVAFSGISAMPSIHVSLATLFLLVGWHYGRFARIFFSAFLVMTIVGSIHLGWHYASDGYLSLLMTPPLWWLAGKFVRWYRAKEALPAGAAEAQTP